MTTVLVLCVLIVLALVIPARFDPAIRLREWFDDQRPDNSDRTFR